jgi:hypothetical protein
VIEMGHWNDKADGFAVGLCHVRQA